MSVVITLARSFKRKTRYLLRDLFTTAAGAPLASPHTCEPGPGSLTLVNTTNGSISISSGQLRLSRPTSGQSWSAYGFWVANVTRAPGRTLYFIAQSSAIDRLDFGVRGSGSVNQTDAGLMWGSTTSLAMRHNAGSEDTVGTSLTANTDYQMAIVMRGAGQAYFVRGGSQYPAWTLLGVTTRDSALTNNYLSVSNFNSDLKMDAVAILDKPGLWTRGYGATSAFSLFPASGDTAVSPADALMYFTWTPIANETLSLYFRRTDDDNTYRLDCAQAGGTIKLYRRESGVDTELDAGKTQTWTAGTPYRIGIVYAGTTIRTYVESTGLKHTATGQTFNQSATGCKVSGFTLGANWELWPRTFNGTDAVSLKP